MFRPTLVSIMMLGMFSPVAAGADTQSLPTTPGANFVNLISGNLYEVTLTYSNTLLSYWTLTAQHAVGQSLVGSSVKLFTGGLTSSSGKSVDFTFTAQGSSESGDTDLAFSYASYFGQPVSVTITNAKITGSFGESGISAPGPVAGTGLAGLALAAMAFMGLRRKRVG